jgi:hypothetical protein
MENMLEGISTTFDKNSPVDNNGIKLKEETGFPFFD